MTQFTLPQCYRCKNLDPNTGQATITCRAFPKGVPWQILEGRVGHSKPVEGDHGVRFEQLDGPDGLEVGEGEGGNDAVSQ